jgi:hypothetical protein
MVRNIVEQVDDAVAEGATVVAELVAEEAKDHHTFTNRTGKLEASIKPGGTRGTFSRDSLAVRVTANRPYASYVEDNNPVYGLGPNGETVEQGTFAYLLPAYVEVEQEAHRIIEDAIFHGVRRAGWGVKK